LHCVKAAYEAGQFMAILLPKILPKNEDAIIVATMLAQGKDCRRQRTVFRPPNLR
jgi:hypothetical protein